MTATIVLMVLLNAGHPPAVSTALSFVFSAGAVNNLGLFGLALALVTLLVVSQRVSVWLLADQFR
jgi:hypothetical protein